MAIKAGLVGVNPKGVDHNGMPIGSSGDTAKQLEANGNKFYFAYDETTQKYGYKLNGAGEFIPFDQAGAVGINIPNASITGLTIDEHFEYIDGGFEVSDGMCYGDITLLYKTQATSGAVPIISGLPNADNTTNVHRFTSSSSPTFNSTHNPEGALISTGGILTNSNWNYISSVGNYFRYLVVFKISS